MKKFLEPLVCLATASFLVTDASSQAQLAASKSAVTSSQVEKSLFESDSILHIKLIGNIRELMNDRTGTPKSYPFVFSYKAESGNDDSLNITARTRGHFRKSMGDCTYPPVLLEFSKSDNLMASAFKEQERLKLVMPCAGEDYVIREWMVYKIYNVLTPQSFKARLVSVELYDTKKKKSTSPFYGILLEEEGQMAKRNEDVLIKRVLQPQQTDSTAFLRMAMFEYLIGNTDWSVQYQNIKLIGPDSLAIPIPVPYDFDHAGLVNPPYAKPAEELMMNSVRERRYRGYCIPNMGRYETVIGLYNKMKPDIYKLYTNCTLLDAKYVSSTIKYFDDFYETINNPTAFKKEFGYPCDKNGTGNVVIKGLKDEDIQQ